MSDTEQTVESADLGGTGDFSVGGVIGDAFNSFFKNILLFTLLIAILTLPFIILGGASFAAVADGSWIQSGEPLAFVGLFGGIMLVTYLAQIGIIYASAESLSGNKANLGSMLSIIIRSAIPVLIASILVMVMMMVGFVLLIIPGIIVAMMMAVVVPIIVVERVGIIEALSRSRALTSGYKWKIFGAFLLFGIINALIQFLIPMIGAVGGTVVTMVLLLVQQILSLGLNGAMTASVYINLRRAKEGVNVEDIAKVFE